MPVQRREGLRGPMEAFVLAYGLPGAVNGLGDLAASLIVVGLRTLLSPAAFTYVAIAMLAGAILVFRLR